MKTVKVLYYVYKDSNGVEYATPNMDAAISRAEKHGTHVVEKVIEEINVNY